MVYLGRKIFTSQNTNCQKNLLTNKNTVIIATNLWPLKGSSNSYSLMLYLLLLLRPLLFFQVFFIFHDLVYFYFMCVRVCSTHIYAYHTHPLFPQRPMQDIISMCITVWVLKTNKPGSSAQLSSALKCWVTSPALSSDILYCNMFAQL